MKHERPSQPRRIGVLLFDDMCALDAVGPIEAFAAARLPGTSIPCYEPVTIGAAGKSVAAESGVILKPQCSFRNSPRLDTLIIPGGSGLRTTGTARLVSGWIKDLARTTRRIASVCTGIYALAPTGLLDGRRVTTHWRFANDVARRFPAITVDADAIFLGDGRIYTSAGITAGIDLSLALIEEDCGREAALAVARELVVYMKRSGGQGQYSEPLQFQAESADKVAQIAVYIRAHLRRDLSVPVLAETAHLSTRQFSRRFRALFTVSPAAYVEALRLDEARRRLGETNGRIGRIAESVGFASDDAFRRAFAKRFGVAPKTYRRRFATASPH